MDLCHHCDGFARAISERLEPWPGLDSFWNLDRLRADSRNCRLCETIYDYFFTNPAVSETVPTTCSKVVYNTFNNQMHLSGIPTTSVKLSSNAGYVEISVWSDPDSPAALSGNICTEPPLPSNNSPEAFAYIRSWIQTCSQEHELCKTTLSRASVDDISGPVLPTRVLDVGIRNDESISLIETNGRHGNFCALSYCWGPEGTQTLLTTRVNINDHLSGIQFSSLPKTFQDAVVTTRELGIRYLWIDSLCIIQKDKNDWMKEASKMSEVYQKAYLVIAASGAANPNEGCFSNERLCSNAVEVPYYTASGQAAGSMRLSMRVYTTFEEFSPAWGPLAKRGWALQEWYLARRVLHYMPRGISWKCKMIESGERHLYDMGQYSKTWVEILWMFSGRELTHKEDRLAALKGLAQANIEGSDDRYSFGIFESRIPEQLLWMLEEKAKLSEELSDVPCWSWASKGGYKTFWVTQGEWPTLSHTKTIIESSGVLKVDGFMAKSTTSIAKSSKITSTNRPILRELLSTAKIDRKHSLCWIQTVSKHAQTIGVAAFDREYFPKVHILFLKQWRDYEEWAIEPLDENNTGRNVMPYAVLLLMPSGNRDGFFRRVGMGFVIPSPNDNEVSAIRTTIRLI